MTYDVEKAAREWLADLKIPAHEKDALAERGFIEGARQFRDALVERFEKRRCLGAPLCDDLFDEHDSDCPVAIATALRSGRMP